ncbi:hypothetical protein [Halomonas sp.]|uniref:hypothetical protein n=1 Tax=Halomonas sp. TaxID=1486246 RepID=UPI0035685559
MALEHTLPIPLDVPTELYELRPPQDTNINACIGVAKRRFKEDHGIDGVTARKVLSYNGRVIIVATPNLFRDHYDGIALAVTMENEDAVRDYLKDGDEDALNHLAGKADEQSVGFSKFDELRERLDRLIGFFPEDYTQE